MDTRGSSTLSVTVRRRSAVIGGVVTTGFDHRLARRQRTEILLDQRLGARLVEVADDDQGGVVGHVVVAEEFAHIRQPRRLDVGVRPDDLGVVGVALREQVVEHGLVQCPYGTVLGLPALVAHHVLLVGQLGLVERSSRKPMRSLSSHSASSSWLDGTVSK